MEEDAMLARFTRRPRLALLGAVALAIAIANPAAAPPGDLDSSFDGDGKVTTTFDVDSDHAGAVAIQGDGKIVAAGCAFCEYGESGDFALVRYNTDGSLDPTFDTDGKVTTDFAGSIAEAQGVAIQGDGKIVAAGLAFVSPNYNFALARYNTDGSLDTTFDTDGKVTTNVAGSEDGAFGVAIQEDGKVVAAGCAGASVCASADFAVARYNTDGSLDTTFDTDGKVTTNVAGKGAGASAVAIQGDGKIVPAGFAGSDFALARYNTDGSLDTTFDTDGKITTNVAGSLDGAYGVAIQEDGKIVTAGFADVSGTYDFVLVRYSTNGSLDTTFDGDGKVTTDFAGKGAGASAVAIQGDGKIVTAGGACCFPGNGDFALARYNTDGSLDPTFDIDGLVTTDFAGPGSPDGALAVALQGDGKIVAAGGAGSDFALARYYTDGSLDPTFDADGRVTTDFGGGPPSCAGNRATIIGTQAADTLTGTPQKDVIVGLGGKDSIRAGGGSDIVCAGSGNDNVAGGKGKDRLRGGRGNDRLLGGSGADRLIGGLGRDRLIGGPGSDYLLGGPGKDSQQQ
jgi:uncharacterized delta-60 repeat protein